MASPAAGSLAATRAAWRNQPTVRGSRACRSLCLVIGSCLEPVLLLSVPAIRLSAIALGARLEYALQPYPIFIPSRRSVSHGTRRPTSTQQLIYCATPHAAHSGRIDYYRPVCAVVEQQLQRSGVVRGQWQAQRRSDAEIQD